MSPHRVLMFKKCSVLNVCIWMSLYTSPSMEVYALFAIFFSLRSSRFLIFLLRHMDWLSLSRNPTEMSNSSDWLTEVMISIWLDNDTSRDRSNIKESRSMFNERTSHTTPSTVMLNEAQLNKSLQNQFKIVCNCLLNINKILFSYFHTSKIMFSVVPYFVWLHISNEEHLVYLCF